MVRKHDIGANLFKIGETSRKLMKQRNFMERIVSAKAVIQMDTIQSSIEVEAFDYEIQYWQFAQQILPLELLKSP